MIGNSIGELVTERRTYPWNGHFVRNGDSRTAGYGSINANFVKGNGDYMGVAGALDDFGDITVNVYQYAPNDYGLYNMAGNERMGDGRTVLSPFRTTTNSVPSVETSTRRVA